MINRHHSVKAHIKAFKQFDKQFSSRVSTYSLTSTFIAEQDNWRVTPIETSSLAHISIFKGLSSGSIVMELEHPDKYVTNDYVRDVYAVVLTNGQLEYVEVISWCRKGGMELETTPLATVSSFCYPTVTTCLNLLLACQKAINASTKINAQTKQTLLEQIKADHDYVLQFIQQIPPSPHEKQAKWLHYEIQRLSEALHINSRYYWSQLSEHDDGDFDMSMARA